MRVLFIIYLHILCVYDEQDVRVRVGIYYYAGHRKKTAVVAVQAVDGYIKNNNNKPLPPPSAATTRNIRQYWWIRGWWSPLDRERQCIVYIIMRTYVCVLIKERYLGDDTVYVQKIYGTTNTRGGIYCFYSTPCWPTSVYMYIVVIHMPLYTCTKRENYGSTHTSDAVVGVQNENIFLVNTSFLFSSICARMSHWGKSEKGAVMHTVADAIIHIVHNITKAYFMFC